MTRCPIFVFNIGIGFKKVVSVVYNANICDKEVIQMRTSALIGAKNFGIFKIYGVSAWTRGEGD